MWDRTLQPVKYSNWAPDEPNNGENETFGRINSINESVRKNGEDCVVNGFCPKGMWCDMPCDLHFAFALCEHVLSVECTNNLYTVVGIGIVEFVLLLIFVICFFIRRRQESLDVNKDVNGYTRPRDSYYYGRQDS